MNLISKHLSHSRWDGWSLVVLAIAILVATPVGVVLSSVVADTGDVWAHLVSTVLSRYILNSVLLMIGVGIGVASLGISTAWLVTMCQFPGQRYFEWALLLPLAAPSYILAYTYTELLEYYGPVQTTLRNWFGWESVNDYWFPDVRSLPGAIIMLSLVLYPYVYLLTRVAFLEQSICTLEASRSLGCNPWRSFFTVALPLARPAITAGVALALMETLNDFGTVQFFSVDTFTTGIYRTWFGMGERLAAGQLSACLLTLVFLLLGLERWSRRQARYYQSSSRTQGLCTYSLHGWRQAIALLTCGLPILLGLIVPTGLLLQMVIKNWEDALDNQFWQLASRSFGLALVSAAIATIIALVLAYGLRLRPTWEINLGVRIAAIGYAIPGSVIAVGILIPAAQVDNAINHWLEQLFNFSPGLIINGTVVVLIFAYLVRFLTVSYSSVDSSLSKIRPSLDDASRSLGRGATETLVSVHAPLLVGGLLTAVMLVFVDVMKELPATLVMRPFNFDTLAVRVYQYASDERLVEAAAPALAIVLVGLLPVILLSWQISQARSRILTKS